MLLLALVPRGAGASTQATPETSPPVAQVTQPTSAGASDADRLRPSQPQRPPTSAPGPAAAGPALAVRGLVDVGIVSFAAADSFTAVYGSNGGLTWGGGVQVAHRVGWFVQAHASQFKADGERAFVADGQVFPLGIPSRLTIVPVELSAGWRFIIRRRPVPGRPVTPPVPVVPYLGGGVGLLRVTERDDLAETDETVDDTHTSYVVLGGIEVPVRRWLGAGVEAGWRAVPDALVESSLAQAFGETSLNQFFLTFRVTVGR